MAEPLKILVIMGSVREGRMAEPVAHWVMEGATDRAALDLELVDLKDWDLPFYPFAKPPAAGDYQDPLQLRWAEKIAGADGYILICPEYNHGIPAVLKNALDFVYAEWHRKPVTFVGYGGNGGARSIEQLTMVARELRMAPLEASVHIMSVWSKAAGGSFTPDDKDSRWIGHLYDELTWWGRTLRAGRKAAD
ncbi:NADPH-dependent FMN reductase [Sphingomonas sp. Sphisp140]|uniref:NADPH-dependent FMN reductase n=1 Tax=unclassified Sphingomonas TaxID=196159 RepID=UPI0039B022ED